jgi:MscS family membrane protein
LAAKDMIGNLFGSVTVVMDRPFHIGDWVVIGDVEGTVENVGFRSTRIRTFYNSLVSLPNAQLTTTKIDNMGARQYRRMSTLLSLTYDTPPERIEAFCAGIRQLVELHPYMRKDYYHVYLNQFAAASLDILVYVFWKTPDWGKELQERQRFLLDILRLAKELQVEFAFPTQTLMLRQDQAPGEREPLTSAQALALGEQRAQEVVRRNSPE